jgi:peptidoglycan/LPS O-acetylase OafA/YrhL
VSDKVDGVTAAGPTRPEEAVVGYQFPILDTLRAVGAVSVVATHTSFWAGSYTHHGPWGSVLARLDVGVAIFFVLSGFLLSRPWIARAQAGRSRPSVGRYFWKRFLRIVPLYVVTAAIALALIRENDGLSAAHWLSTLTLTDIYVREVLPAGLTQMWSLATEVMFYLVLPLLMRFAIGSRLSPRRFVLLLTVMVLVNIAWLAGLSSRVPRASELPVNEWLPAFLTWFAVGMGLSLAHELVVAGRAHTWLLRTVDVASRAPGTLWVIAGGLLLVSATPLAGPTLLVAPTESEALVKHVLYAAVGGLLVFTGVFVRHGGGYQRFMAQPWLRHLGYISYGIFCIHLPILHLVMWWTGWDLFQGHGFAIFVLTLTMSVAAAEVLYRVVEKPLMSLKDLGRRSPANIHAPERATTTRY